jgi:hypothetical protein
MAGFLPRRIIESSPVAAAFSPAIGTIAAAP